MLNLSAAVSDLQFDDFSNLQKVCLLLFVPNSIFIRK